MNELVKEILLFILALGGIVLFFFLLNKAYRWILKKIDLLDQNLFFKKTKFSSFFKYITPRRERDILVFLAKLLRIAIIVVFLIFYTPILFRIFPQTREISDTVLGYLKKPLVFLWEGIIGFIPNLFFILVIFYITKYLLRFIKYLADELEREAVRIDGFHADWARPTYNLAKVVIIAFSLVIVFPYIPGSDSKAFTGVSIFFGVLFSLGSTSAISNIVAGIVITYMRPFRLGDRVQIGETIGDVTDKSLLVTRVRTIKNLDITIPNSAILNNHIVNFSKNAAEDIGIILHTSVTIGYDVPSNDVINALVEGASRTEAILDTPKPFVLIKSLDDFYVNYEINAYTKSPEKSALIYSRLHDSIKDAMHDAGIEILSPHYNAIRDGNQLTVPPKNVPQDYKKSGFIIQPNHPNE